MSRNQFWYSIWFLFTCIFTIDFHNINPNIEQTMFLIYLNCILRGCVVYIIEGSAKERNKNKSSQISYFSIPKGLTVFRGNFLSE